MIDSAEAERKIAAPADLHHDQLRHQQLVVAAEDLRRDVVADGQHEGEEGADHDAGQRQRQDDVDEGPDRPGAEIGRGLAVARAELLQIGEDRQRQQHDEEMHEADRPWRAACWRAAPARRTRPVAGQRAVDDAVLGQHQQPAVGAHDIGGPERQHRQHQRQPLPALRHLLGEDPGERIGEQHRDDGDDRRHLAAN